MAKILKKIVIFLVEGKTDKLALGSIISDIFADKRVHFEIIRTDLLSAEEIRAKDVEYELIKKIEEIFFKKPYYKEEDVIKVIQIIDTDGGFVPCEFIKQATDNVTKYEEDLIYAKDKARLIARNIKKREKIFKLLNVERLGGVYSYSVFYFSRNIEHVLYNKSVSNISDIEKEELADNFSDQYIGKEDEFVSFISDHTFAVHTSYIDSWRFIFEGTNSLHRYSNFHILFQQL